MIGVTHQTAWLASDRERLWAPALPHDPYTYGKRNNLKQLGLAVHSIDEVFGGLPSPMPLEPGQAEHSWATQILPYSWNYAEIDLQKPWDHPDNQAEAKKLVPLLLNSDVFPLVLRDENGYGVSHYAGNRNLFEAPQRLSLEDISDGASNTLMIGEIPAKFPPWAKPRTNRDPALGINRSPDGFGSPSGNEGTVFLMADGSVRELSRQIAPEVVEAFGTPNGKEPIDESLPGP
jgi:hypothetical protein